MPESLTGPILLKMIRALEGRYEAELLSLDAALASALQLGTLALAIYPLSGVLLARFRKDSGAIERRAALLCGVCGSEVEARTVRCPSCAVVFPSPILRSLVLFASLWLAWWTAAQGENVKTFTALIAAYVGSAIWVGLWFILPGARTRPVFAWPAAACSVAFEGIVRLRELGARLSAIFDGLLLLLFWAGLFLVCQGFGWPLAQDDAGLGDVLGKLALLAALLSVVCFTASLWVLRPPFGLSISLTAAAIGLIMALLAVLAHGAESLIGTRLRLRAEDIELRAFRGHDEAIYLSFRGLDQGWSRALVRVASPGQLELFSARVSAETLGWSLERISRVSCQTWEGPALPSLAERSKNLGVWQILWEPENALILFSGASPVGAGADWLASLELLVKDDAQRWVVELPLAEEQLIRLQGGRLIQKNVSTGELQSLEAN